MKRLIWLVLAVLCCYGAQAVPAYRGLISYTQPDGSVIRIRLHGDEFCHWATNEAGQVVEQGEDGFYRVADPSRAQARLEAGRRQRETVNRGRRSAVRRGVASGQKHFLVILVEFSDVQFTYTNEDFSNLLNLAGYSDNGGHGSARDFYYDNSHGVFEPVFDVYGPVTLTNNQAYYGGNDSNGNDKKPHYAVRDGCQGLDSQIDFSQYDNDKDGEVDLVFMYYAGKGEADGGPANSIWPHQWELSSGGISLTLDGKKVNKYACTNEIVSYGALANKLCGIGTACHEFGHAMGLPDFYDTDYDDYNGEAGGLYDYSTMCGGSYNENGRRPPYFNMEERILLGWLNENTAIPEISVSGTYTLTSVNDNVAYKTLTDTDGEYFLYECRAKTGWDTDIPEAGMIVYHVDKSTRSVTIRGSSSNISVTAKSLWDNWTTYNSINENGSHPCFYVVPAGSQSNLNYSGTKFAFPGSANQYTFTGTGWSGAESEVKLSNISYSGNTVSFYAEAPSSTLNYNVITTAPGGYHAGDSFPLTLQESASQPVSSVAWFFDDEPISGTSVILPAGRHVVEAHLTLLIGETKILELTLDVPL